MTTEEKRIQIEAAGHNRIESGALGSTVMNQDTNSSASERTVCNRVGKEVAAKERPPPPPEKRRGVTAQEISARSNQAESSAEQVVVSRTTAPNDDQKGKGA